MADPTSTLLRLIEQDVARCAGAMLVPATRGSRLPDRITRASGRKVPPGVAAFFARFDGGTLGQGIRILSVQESIERRGGTTASVEMKGLWPLLEQQGRLFALDCEFPGSAGEWPVVEVMDRSVDRAGTSLLRFLYAVLGELLYVERDELERARELCRRDPGYADYWLDFGEGLEQVGRFEEADRALTQGTLASTPPSPALAMAVAMRAFDREEPDLGRAALEDALMLEPLTARDDDARLDAAAVTLVDALDRGETALVRKARDLLGQAGTSTGAFWRGEAVRALVATPAPRMPRALLSLKIVETLIPEDRDVARLRTGGGNLESGLKAFVRAREALDRGEMDDALRQAKQAASEAPELGIVQALLAETMNAKRDRGAMDAAKRATELNPSLVDAWRELGDACLEGRQAVRAEEAYREIVRRDPTSGVGYAKLAQALLEQGRSREALETVEEAGDRGGDAFFVAAVKGDILSEMNRHRDAGEAYDQALRIEPEDHWALHQAALEWGQAGEMDKAAELYERAVASDKEGCHQTFIDYADLLRRMGRIGDAVRMYRKAVAAVPTDSEWRQHLREAEKELNSAPN